MEEETGVAADLLDVRELARIEWMLHVARGHWVAVVGEKIVASGESAKDVYDEDTRAFPGREPFLMKVPSEKVLIL